MAKSGLKHIDVGPELTKTEWESEESHELLHGSSFPSSPVERQLFYRDDEHKWYIYNGSEWIWLGGGGGGMEVHGNEYHDPDFEQQGVAATLIETHRTTATHTQSQPAAEHGNEKHNPDFEQQGVAATLIETHRTTETHTQPQPAAEHGNEKHNPDFATEAALSSHASATQGAHGIPSPLVIGHKLSPRCKVYRSGTAQSIPEATNTKIQYNAEEYDNYNEFDPTANYRFTPTVAGWYLILGCYQIELNLDGAEFAHKVYKNGAEYAIHINTTGMVCWGIQGTFYLVYCNGTSDYLEFYAWQQKPGQGAKNLTASQTRNFVEIFLWSNM